MLLLTLRQPENSGRTEVLDRVRYIVNNPHALEGQRVVKRDETSIPNPFVTTRTEYMTTRGLSFTAKTKTAASDKLCIITAGGVMSGVDAALYLISMYVGMETAIWVADLIQFNWAQGVVVD
jgi:hypothetical protein